MELDLSVTQGPQPRGWHTQPPGNHQLCYLLSSQKLLTAPQPRFWGGTMLYFHLLLPGPVPLGGVIISLRAPVKLHIEPKAFGVDLNNSCPRNGVFRQPLPSCPPLCSGTTCILSHGCSFNQNQDFFYEDFCDNLGFHPHTFFSYCQNYAA